MPALAAEPRCRERRSKNKGGKSKYPRNHFLASVNAQGMRLKKEK
jgi:hypothetical protein